MKKPWENKEQEKYIDIVQKLGFNHISEINIKEIRKDVKLTTDELLELEAENFFYRYRNR